MDPGNGHVKAYAGGPDFKYFKYDPISVQKRQAGSIIKPFLYTLAMQEGLSPCMEVANVPISFEINDTVWTPKNSGSSKMEGKMVTLKWGLANSVNWISAWVMKRFNPQSVIDVMRKMGITSHLEPVPSLFLGTSDMSLYEMVGAYSTFANKGVHTSPLLVTRIEDEHGNVLQQFVPKTNEALSEQTAFLMLNLMMGVVNQGTAIRLRYMFELETEIAGKTGTTQNHSDGWFMGITPDLVTGVWVGGEDRGIHFDGIRLGQGASMALPIWAIYMKDLYADPNVNISEDPFEAPDIFNVQINCEEFERNNMLDPTEYDLINEAYGPEL
jgi:penicillin-binding protein 1A